MITFTSSDRNGWIAYSKTSAQWYRQSRCKHVKGYANDDRAEWHEVEVDAAGCDAVATIWQEKRKIDMKFKLRFVQCLTLLVSLGALASPALAREAKPKSQMQLSPPDEYSRSCDFRSPSSWRQSAQASYWAARHLADTELEAMQKHSQPVDATGDLLEKVA